MFMIGCQSIRALITTTLVMTMLLSCFVGRLGTMERNIPKEINGWRADVKVDAYDRKTLFHYIDGGAELYLAYHFQKVYVHTYTKAGEPDIIMDIYEMGTPEDAFGVFTSEREGEDIGIGQGSEYEAGLLRFFKGRFFVSIMTYEETPQSRKAVYLLARTVADAIQSTGDKPKLVSSLPSTGLSESSILYFYSHTILNQHYFVASENILKFDKHTKAVLARYSVKEGELYLLIVRYPTTQHAKMAHTSFLNDYMPDAIKTGIVQTENGKWTATDLHNHLLTIVFDAPTRSSGGSLLETVRIQLGAKP